MSRARLKVSVPACSTIPGPKPCRPVPPRLSMSGLRGGCRRSHTRGTSGPTACPHAERSHRCSRHFRACRLPPTSSRRSCSRSCSCSASSRRRDGSARQAGAARRSRGLRRTSRMPGRRRHASRLRGHRRCCQTKCKSAGWMRMAAMLGEMLAPKGSHGNEGSDTMLMVTRYEAPLVGILPGGQPGTRGAPRGHDLPIGLRLGRSIRGDRVSGHRRDPTTRPL
jgi:hypothetical protein